ncbi:hypothetical protein SAMN02745244_00965 [Tessaracoccus bendigoensis DSM 12906]|uniref:Uncharacterized protein n=2 Tax=Tessaracoccus TaxID=72763 RepID=A0A1M6DM13_9ACTN|nr:hypothetical protein SAMN02745244_00965 [Tessaracoccus bendigoensis DSM 12906]
MSNQQWNGAAAGQGPQGGYGPGGYPPGQQGFPQPGPQGFPPPGQPGFPPGGPGRRSGGGVKVALIVGGAVVLVAVLALVVYLALGGARGGSPGPVGPSPSRSAASSPSASGGGELTMADLPMPLTVGVWEYLPGTDRQSGYTADKNVFGPVLVTLGWEGDTMELYAGTLDDPSVSDDGRVVCGTFDAAPMCYIETAEGLILSLNTGDPEDPPPAEFRALVDAVFEAVG